MEDYRMELSIKSLYFSDLTSSTWKGSASEFEKHAGYESRRKPYGNIFILNGPAVRLSLSEYTYELKISVEQLYICIGCGWSLHRVSDFLKSSRNTRNKRCMSCYSMVPRLLAQCNLIKAGLLALPILYAPSLDSNADFSKNYVNEVSLRLVACVLCTSRNQSVLLRLLENSELFYKSNGETLLTGRKQGHKICCNCCNTKFSTSKFEAHAGKGSRKKPYHNIYDPNGVILHAYATQQTENRRIQPDGSDLVASDLIFIKQRTYILESEINPSGNGLCSVTRKNKALIDILTYVFEKRNLPHTKILNFIGGLPDGAKKEVPKGIRQGRGIFCSHRETCM